ncbi:unnamed protein product [Prunus armeniaca]
MTRRSKVGRSIQTTGQSRKGKRLGLLQMEPRARSTMTRRSFQDCPRRKNLNAIVTERERGAEEGSNLQVSPMVLLNSLRVIPPEDLLGEDAIEQLVLEVIEVFVNVFVMEPLEIFIDASLVHKGMLIEAIENMEPNWI